MLANWIVNMKHFILNTKLITTNIKAKYVTMFL